MNSKAFMMLGPGTGGQQRGNWTEEALILLLSSQAHGQRSDHSLSVKMWAGRNMQWHYSKVVQPIFRTEATHVLLFFFSTLEASP